MSNDYTNLTDAQLEEERIAVITEMERRGVSL